MQQFPHIYRKGVAENMLYAWFSAMHTRVDLMLVAALDEGTLLCVAEEIKRRIAEIESFADSFNPDSELARYNTGAISREQLCAELQGILRQCEEWKLKTDGLFDVNVGGKTNLSGFIKGYALDAIKEIINRKHIPSALINMGNSSIMGIGNRPGDDDG